MADQDATELRDRIADALHRWTLDRTAGGRAVLAGAGDAALRENSLARADAVMAVVQPEVDALRQRPTVCGDNDRDLPGGPCILIAGHARDHLNERSLSWRDIPADEPTLAEAIDALCEMDLTWSNTSHRDRDRADKAEAALARVRALAEHYREREAEALNATEATPIDDAENLAADIYDEVARSFVSALTPTADHDEDVVRIEADDSGVRDAVAHSGQLLALRQRAEEAEAGIREVRRLCDMTIAGSIRAGAIQQAEDTLAALDRALARAARNPDGEPEIRPPDPECGTVRTTWDGPYRMDDACTARPGHPGRHGPWRYISEPKSEP